MDTIFDWCVALLMWLAELTGTTYKAINVIIFCILWPLVTIILVVWCVKQRVLIRKLRKTRGST